MSGREKSRAGADGRRLRSSRRQIAEPAVFGRLLATEDVPLKEYYFYINPMFQTGAPKYAWLNQVIAVGRGKVVPGGVEYRVWTVENAG
ncbi:MAG: DUF3237 domain-containing protein [Chloroflexi bacterium]|nr:MAG: DUF3237 domain-containing protein [Chloroflexota bacterium]